MENFINAVVQKLSFRIFALFILSASEMRLRTELRLNFTCESSEPQSEWSMETSVVDSAELRSLSSNEQSLVSSPAAALLSLAALSSSSSSSSSSSTAAFLLPPLPLLWLAAELLALPFLSLGPFWVGEA